MRRLSSTDCWGIAATCAFLIALPLINHLTAQSRGLPSRFGDNSSAVCGEQQSVNLGALGTSARKAGGIYQNGTGCPMQVAVSMFYFGGGTGSFGCNVDTHLTPLQTVIAVQIANGQQTSMSFQVPNGAFYSCGVASINSPTYWTEWY